MHLPIKENMPTNSTPKVGWMPLVLLYIAADTTAYASPYTFQAGTSWAESACRFLVAEEPRREPLLGAPLLASSLLIYCIGSKRGRKRPCVS